MVVVLLVVTGPHLCMGRLKISKVKLKLKKNSCVARSDEDEPGSRYVIYINVQLYVSYFKIHLLTNYFKKIYLHTIRNAAFQTAKSQSQVNVRKYSLCGSVSKVYQVKGDPYTLTKALLRVVAGNFMTLSPTLC